MMAPTYLDEILARHRLRASLDQRDWRGRVGEVTYAGPSMYEALAAHQGVVKVIAEVKRRSPSKGWLNEYLLAGDVARQYESGGAAAISVLTDEEGFAGTPADLRDVTRASTLPVLRKDFTVCANDVLDTAQMGASTVLLIVAALSDDELRDLLVLAEACAIDALVEVHDHDEAQRAIDLGARIIGVNQRNLRTFEVDTLNAASVIGSLPSSVVAVCESGLSTSDDVRRAGDVGFDAVLVGEAFVTSSAMAQVVRSFTSMPRTARG